MSESDNNGDKTLTVAPSKTLHLKPRTTEQGMVRQSFSHGRSKVVVVEKVRRRAPGGSETSKPAAAAVPSTAAPTPPAPPPPNKQ
jgi:translation initiation factor IF-2